MAKKPEGDDLDLMVALGVPESGSKSKKKYGGKLKNKPPELIAFLEDATDDSLPQEQRMEALCSALEFDGGYEEEAPEAEALDVADADEEF